MTEQQKINDKALKIHRKRVLQEKIQKVASELYDAESKLNQVYDSVKVLHAKHLKACNQLQELEIIWDQHLSDRDYDKFCKEYTRITN